MYIKYSENKKYTEEKINNLENEIKKGYDNINKNMFQLNDNINYLIQNMNNKNSRKTKILIENLIRKKVNYKHTKIKHQLK